MIDNVICYFIHGVMHDANMYQTISFSRFLIIAKKLLFETNAYDYLLFFTFQIFSQTM
jgi:hypothetical protein